MPKCSYRTGCLLIVAMMLPAPGFAMDPKVRSYLAAQSMIRVGIEYGPGAGHQSTAPLIVRGLRHLGYAGPIEVVTPIAFLPLLRESLALFFPGFDPEGPGDQRLPPP